MKVRKTILAAFHRPIQITLEDSLDVIKLKVNRVAGTNFTTTKKPLQLLKEMPALDIANKGFYANAKVKLKVNSKFEIASTEEILIIQSEFIKDLIEKNKQSIKDIAIEKFDGRYKNRYAKTNGKRNEVTEQIQDLAKYIKSNKIILWVMLIPVFLFIILIIIYLNN